jgi:CRISPR-associated autoregulator DevR family
MKTAQNITLLIRVTLNTHALNNEGTENNEVKIRKVGVVKPKNKDEEAEYIENINAVSGKMLKHMFDDALIRWSKDMKLPINPASAKSNPLRIFGDPDFVAYVSQAKDIKEVYDYLLTCTLTDVSGILTLEEAYQIKRQSRVKLSWAVGLPEFTQHKKFQFLRNQPAYLGDKYDLLMPYTTQTASGIYGLVAHIELNGIGYNDLKGTYPEKVADIEIDRKKRMDAVLQALATMLLRPNGASTSTQLPHMMGLEGLACISESHIPASVLSPLADNYREQTLALIELDNLSRNGKVEAYEFTTPAEFMGAIHEIKQNFEPGQL